MKHLIKLLNGWHNKKNYKTRNIIKACKDFDIVGYSINSEGSAGEKILFFTDLHLQDDDFYFTALTREINEINADWIIFGGDLLTLLPYHKAASQFLSGLKAKKSKIAVLGNWEIRRLKWITLDEWIGFFSNSGFTLLTNTTFHTENLKFYGVSSLLDKPFKRSSKDFVGFKCLISHKPEDAVLFIKNSNLNPDLILCGHTHGGQIRLPCFGAVYTSSIYWKLFEYGHYYNKRSDTDLIVSGGLGYTGIKKRFLCRPEIVQINI
ncbi:MAG: metallophosphoesterase [Victivallales bacterium]|nr:metallophosphoesterase [Victivallales bacterium]